MKKVSKVFIGILGLLAVLALFIVYQPQYSTHDLEPDHNIKIGKLYTEFQKNETRASQMYIGKVIQTSGYIKEIQKDVTGANVLLLSKTMKSDPLILCTLDANHDTPSADANLTVGKQVTVKGQCTGMLLEVVLKNGILLD